MTEPVNRALQRKSKASFKRMAKLIDFCRRHESFTQRELLLATGLSRTTVQDIVGALRKAEPEPLIHVGRWQDDATGRPTIRVYEWGNKPDAKKREPLPTKVRTQLYLERRERRAQFAAQQAILSMAATKEPECNPSET